MKVILVLLFLWGFTHIKAQKTVVLLNSLSKDLRYLASDALKGRGTGSPEERTAADFIAKRFESIGLKPVKGSYLKPFNSCDRQIENSYIFHTLIL